MRINDTSTINRASGIKKKNSKKQNSDGDFSILLSDSSDDGGIEASSINSMQPMASLGGLLAVQTVDNHLEQKKMQLKQGNNLLNYLDELKNNLLLGRISPLTVQNLLSAIKQRHGNAGDTELNKILSEIELRTEVEIAKLDLRYKQKN